MAPDRIELTPTYWCHEVVVLGKIKASELEPKKWSGFASIFLEYMGDRELWVVARRERYDDGHETSTLMNVMDGTEEEARRAVEGMIDFCKMSKQELEEQGKCFNQTEADLAYIRNRFPDSPPERKITGKTEEERREQIEKSDLYQARLRVLAGMHPKTVTLMEQAYAAEGPAEREQLERQAVQAYFAELAHYWSEDEVLAWQRKNPVGTEWMCEFSRVFHDIRPP